MKSVTLLARSGLAPGLIHLGLLGTFASQVGEVVEYIYNMRSAMDSPLRAWTAPLFPLPQGPRAPGW